MKSEIQNRAEFSQVRYAQCWEDADVLVAALRPQPGAVCVSIASAGDNTLALLTGDPERVVAVDMNPAQIACLELRIAAWKTLEHTELLELIGSIPSRHREDLYRRARVCLSPDARRFWDGRGSDVRQGIGECGKFESYFRLFRTRVLSLVHRRSTIESLLRRRDKSGRERFYREVWDNARWRAMFRLFFSKTVMGRLGRDPEFFRYVDVPVSQRILDRTRYALTELEPFRNPYLQWILTGRHRTALPLPLRKKHFEHIRDRIDRVEWRLAPLEEVIAELGENSVDAFNLSDIFEYMSEQSTTGLLEKLADASRPGARLAYWNMLVPRSRPESLADRLQPRTREAERLFARDKAFFYSRFVIEEAL